MRYVLKVPVSSNKKVRELEKMLGPLILPEEKAYLVRMHAVDFDDSVMSHGKLFVCKLGKNKIVYSGQARKSGWPEGYVLMLYENGAIYEGFVNWLA